MKSIICFFFLSSFWLSSSSAGLLAQSDKIEQARQIYTLGVESYKTGDYRESLHHFHQALRLRPNHPGLIYNVAALNAKVGNTKDALFFLDELADQGLVFAAGNDSDFIALRDSGTFQEILAKFEKNRKPVSNATFAISLPEKDLLTEGVAYDPDAEKFYLGSVHKRKIVSIDKNGEVEDFVASGQDGLWGVFGLRIDVNQNVLWACTGVAPQMQGVQTEAAGHSGVFCFDLKDGKLLKKYIVYGDEEEPHLLGDLLLHSNGDVLATDSRQNIIYRVVAENDRLEEFLSPGRFVSLQGLALSADEKLLFVADYSQGIFVVDMETKNIEPLINHPNFSLLGIDGLYFYKNSLVAIQNGVTPHRVLRLYLDTSLHHIKDIEILEANHPAFDEPTLGTIADDTFYFIANSQWGSFGEDGLILPEKELQAPTILGLKID